MNEVASAEENAVTVRVCDIRKTFKLSKKQMKIDHATSDVKVAVDGVSFETKRGEIFGLLGPNGAGKTTVMRCIATLIKPDSGTITVNGKDASDDISIKRQMAFLSGELKLEAGFTPNYIYDFFSGLYGIDKKSSAIRKKDLFERFGIDKFAEVKIGELSQGMKQKVSIAVSLVHDPDIIVFDEPTNGLDVVTARVVTDYLVELRNQGKTVILSTHIMSLPQKICDRIGIIYGGKMLVCDTTENLLKKSGKRDLEDIFFDLISENGGAEA